MTKTFWYCDNFDILHGIRLGILFAAESPIDVSHVLESDNQSFAYMLIDKDPLGCDESGWEFLSRDGTQIKFDG